MACFFCAYKLTYIPTKEAWVYLAAVIESFFHTLKVELLEIRDYDDPAEAR